MPTKSITSNIQNNLSNLNIKLIATTSKAIMQMIRLKNNYINSNSDAGIYKINCKSCSLKYIGENFRK